MLSVSILLLRINGVMRLLLCVGLVVSTMTDLRFPGMPIGLGDVFLIFYIFFTLWARLLFYKISNWRDFFSTQGRFFSFYSFFFLLLLIGCWHGNVTGLNSYEDSTRDLFAYAFCFLISFSVAITDESRVLAMETLRSFLWVCLSGMAVVWVWATGGGELDTVNPWYGGVGVRFSGLSTNPNQVAALFVSMPFLLLFAFRNRATRPWVGRARIVVAALGLAAGWRTGSMALQIIWLVFIPAVIFVAIFFREKRTSFAAEWDFIITVALSVCFVLFSLTMGPSLGPGAAHAHPGFSSEGAVRFDLWRNAWTVIRSSPLLGYGPGPLSGITGSFGGSEAHNSLIDWTMAVGLIGGAALLTLVLAIVWQSLSVKRFDLLVALSSLMVFSLAHHILRHPFVWVQLTLVALSVGFVWKGNHFFRKIVD